MGIAHNQAAGVVTPEAVRLEFAEADVGSRTVALLLDFAILGAAVWLLNTSLDFIIQRIDGGGIPGWVATTAAIVFNFVLILGYPLVWETFAHGKTPGKFAMGLRVVTVEGGPVQFRHAAIRSAFWLVDFLLTVGLGAVVSTLLSKRHQRLGDMVAGTVVLRERSATARPEAAVFTVPAGAEDYAATIDATGLTAAEYETVREFLLRAPTLREDPRDAIGRRIMNAVAPKVNHDVPRGVGPVVFLTCLAARYQERSATATPAAASPPIARPDFTQPEAPPAEAADPGTSWGDFAPPR